MRSVLFCPSFPVLPANVEILQGRLKPSTSILWCFTLMYVTVQGPEGRQSVVRKFFEAHTSFCTTDRTKQMLQHWLLSEMTLGNAGVAALFAATGPLDSQGLIDIVWAYGKMSAVCFLY